MDAEQTAALQARADVLIRAARQEAEPLAHAYVGVEHLFLGMSRQADGSLAHWLTRSGLDSTELRAKLRGQCGMGKGFSPAGALTPRALALLQAAAEAVGPDRPIDEAALLSAMIEEGESLPMRYLASLGWGRESLLAELGGGPAEDMGATRLARGERPVDATRLAQRSPAGPAHVTPPAAAVAGPAIKPAPAKPPLPSTLATPTLDRWGRDLTQLARDGRLADAIGREHEIEQMVLVLARTQKANPILLGEAGTGKTAIVEGLAWRIAQGQVPPVLKGKRVVELAMGTLTAGTQYRGQFEERMRQVIKEASSAPEVILFIDEIHTIVGAGDSEGGSGDAAQMFKPALARGDISCIGATTQDEFARFIRRDPALERRFSPVTIRELTPEATLQVLRAVAARIIDKQAAEGFAVAVAPEALAAAVALTDRFVRDRHQPDKAIDAVDTACAAAVVRGRPLVAEADVAQVVSDWTGIPTTRLNADQQQRYARMDSELSRTVVGQDGAVGAVCRSVRAALAGMKAENRPVGVFLFVGPSGVGKTKLAKELAAFLFDTAEALIRFDMNEYQEKHTAANLIGAPVGYTGNEQGGQFTEAVRVRPYSVVLLDEVEKAHPDVLNLFLGVFDDGRIRDNRGRVIDCSNALFILTSNLGADEVDFAQAGEEELRKLAQRFLRPELVNRITQVIGFVPLTFDQLSRILEQTLAEKTRQLAQVHGVRLVVDQLAKDLIIELAYDPRMGARPLERAVDRFIVQPLVDRVFGGGIRGGTLTISATEAGIVFREGE